MNEITHPLRAWRDSQEPKVTIRRFCALLIEAAGDGREVISSASLCRIENGQQPPSARLMRLAEKVTGGAVQPNDFILHGPH